jgi:hypothetical protein
MIQNDGEAAGKFRYPTIATRDDRPTRNARRVLRLYECSILGDNFVEEFGAHFILFLAFL